MTITAKQLARRKHTLGSSDMPAIMGVDPYRSSYDVWLEKTGQLETLQTNHHMRRGNLLEPAILAFAAEELGKIRRNVYRRLPGKTRMSANVDGILAKDGSVVEAKAVSLQANMRDHWGEAGTDEVPMSVTVQCHAGMACAEADTAYPVAYIDGRGFVLYRVARNHELIDLMMDRAVQFWRDHVMTMHAPEDSEPTAEAVKRRIRRPGARTDIDPEIVSALLSARADKKEAEDRLEIASANLRLALGDAEIGVGHPEYDVTYYQQSRRSVDVDTLRAEHPEIAADHITTKTSRCLRTTKHKDSE